MAEYLLSQHDGRPERAEQLAALRETYSYNLDFGFPVAAGTQDSDEPVTRWRDPAALDRRPLPHRRVLRRELRGRPEPYHYLQPSLIPNSTNI
jgi:hypothetical protein